MLESKGVVKTFDSSTALNGINMCVPQGAVYGLVGPNGAGKTTLLRCAVGAYKPDSGEILVDGEPVWENIGVKSNMFFIPDEPYFYPQATLKQMSDFYSRIYPQFDKALYERLQKAFDFDDRKPLRSMSRGMKKQAAFRLALSARPKFLILDEPVDGLDPVMRRQVWSLIMGAMAESDLTVLISSHNLRELEDVCSHVGIISQGKMILERKLEELQDNIVKLQAVLPEGAALPEKMKVLHEQSSGKLRTFILRAASEEAERAATEAGAVYAEAVPLTLEEIFVYELGGENYAVKGILL